MTCDETWCDEGRPLTTGLTGPTTEEGEGEGEGEGDGRRHAEREGEECDDYVARGARCHGVMTRIHYALIVIEVE